MTDSSLRLCKVLPDERQVIVAIEEIKEFEVAKCEVELEFLE
jgi:hypothetical protein